MTSPQAIKGATFERAVFGYLVDQLGQAVVKRPRVTTADVGDIHAGPACIECKNYRDTTRAVRDAVTEAATAAENAALPYPVGVVKRNGVADPARQLVVMELSTFTRLLRESL